MMPIVVLKEGEQSRLEIHHRMEVASFQESPGEHAEPQFHLIEPGAMCRSEMENVLVSRVHQERATLLPGPQFFLLEGDAAEFSVRWTPKTGPLGMLN
jgi:hypothetical protein